MAFFGVTKEVISEVNPHSNADRLEIAKLAGKSFQFVVPKGQYAVGQEVIYFPIDSLIPKVPLAQLGLTGKLSGKDRNRVKTIRLRTEISQGIVANFDTVGVSPEMSDEEITAQLKVTKYEPPPIPLQNGNLIRLPLGLGKYDIEGADRYADVAEQLMDVPVHVSEKVEGMNFSIAYDANEDRAYVNQRNHSIEEVQPKTWAGNIAKKASGGHMFWNYARSSGLLDAITDLGRLTSGNIVVYGEFVGPGVQGNIYGLTEHKVYLFDCKANGEWQSPALFKSMVNDIFHKMHDANVEMAPTLSFNMTLREWLNGRTIQEASDGKSLLADTRREGIVIKPMENMRSEELGGRLILKQRGPEYLAKSEL